MIVSEGDSCRAANYRDAKGGAKSVPGQGLHAVVDFNLKLA